MAWYLSLLVTLVLLAVGILAGQLFGTGIPMLLILVGSAIFAAIDAERLKMRRYKVSLSSPVFIFLGILLLWIVVFPVYLIERGRVVSGKAELRDKYKDTDA